MADYRFIGKSIPRVDAREKVTGEAVYSSDIHLPGMIVGKCKRSPHPFARILTIDCQKARRLRGVHAVITARDVAQFPYGEYADDQLPLCDSYAHYAGDEVAAVAAASAEAAEEALDLIAVEYEILGPVFNLEEAIAPGAPAVHPELKAVKQNIAYQIDLSRGEGAAGFEQADLILEERFETQAMHQAYLQTRDCVAAWHGENLTLWAVLQSPFRMRLPLARSLGIPEEQIRVIPCSVGGGFGNNALRLWPISALLAKVAGRPVKMVLSRFEDFISGRPLVSEIIQLRMGFKRDGTIVAKKMDILADAGAYTGSCRGVVSVSASRADNLYHIPHIQTCAKLVYTNTVPRGSLRGYGTQTTTFALESMVDMAAKELGISPEEIRLKNAVQEGDTSVHGLVFNSCGFRQTIALAAEKSDWKEKRRKKPEGKKKYGIGMACAIHVAGNRNVVKLYDGSSATVNLDKTGKIRVLSGELDIGQGSETVFAQIVAEEFGVSPEDIRVLPVDTEVSPFALGTFGDRITVLGGQAVKMAAADAKAQFLKMAAEILEANPADLEIREGKIFVIGSPKPLAGMKEVAQEVVFRRGGQPVIGQGNYTVPDFVVLSDAQTQYGNYSIAYTFLTQIAEVLVDPETGKVEVLDVWSAVDLGKAINPKSCEAQIEGGVMMGAGFALSEAYSFIEGKILNPNFHDYKIPSFTDLPRIHSFFVETIDPHTPYGAKSVGEAIGDPTAAAIANAVYDAVGVRLRCLPLVPERVLGAMKNRRRRAE